MNSQKEKCDIAVFFFLQDHIKYETLARYNESSHLKQKNLVHKQNGGIC
jgi:hypothetical protein